MVGETKILKYKRRDRDRHERDRDMRERPCGWGLKQNQGPPRSDGRQNQGTGRKVESGQEEKILFV